jgi:hypothetical protein
MVKQSVFRPGQALRAPRFLNNWQPCALPGIITDGAVASSSRLPTASNYAMIGEEQTVNNVKEGG